MAFGIATNLTELDTDLFAQQEHTLSKQSAGAIVESADGEIECEERHSEVGTITEVFRLYAADDTDGKVDIADHIKAGEIKADGSLRFAVTELRLETSNQQKPILTVSYEQFFGDTSNQAVYTPPFGRIEPRKKAQAIGIVVGADSHLQRCTATLTLQGLDRTDHASDGTFVSTDVYQGRATAEAELMKCTGAAAAVADTANDWELEQAADLEERAKEYGKTTVKAFVAVAADT